MDVIGRKIYRFQVRPCIFQPGNFTGWGSEGVKQNVFIHRNHKFNKQVQETQKQYAYLSVISLYIGDFMLLAYMLMTLFV